MQTSFSTYTLCLFYLIGNLLKIQHKSTYTVGKLTLQHFSIYYSANYCKWDKSYYTFVFYI